MAMAYELDICLPGTFAAEDDDEYYDTAEDQEDQQEEKDHNDDKDAAAPKGPRKSDGVPAALHEIYVPSAQQKQSAKAQYHGDAAVEYDSTELHSSP
jgi:hypothetical protein